MTRPWLIYSLATLGAVLLLLLDLMIWKRLAGPALFLNPSVFLVTVVAVRFGLWPGFAVAGLAGWLYRLFSIYPSLVHPTGFFLAVVVISVLSYRVFTQRSVTSFITLVSIGTATYYLAIFGAAELSHVLQPSAVIPVWRNWTWPLTQILFHPLLAWVLWLLTRRAQRYSTTSLKIEQSF